MPAAAISSLGDEHREGLLPTGSTVGRYVIERVIGSGGSATVYAVTDPDHGGAVAALKVLHRSLLSAPKLIERFVREVETIQRLHHPAIVEIYDFGRLPDGRPYYVMQHLDGMDLEELVRGHGRVSLEEAVEILAPVCAALDLVHRAGVVHRDLKASNVIVSGPAGARQVKVVDFGVAKTPSPLGRGFVLTSVGRQVGTPFFMAPEQIRAENVDARTDVYALGVLLFFLLTRHYPFEMDDPLEIELAHLEAPAPRPSKLAPVTRAIDSVVLRCLEKRPEARPVSALAFLDELQQAVAQSTGPRQVIAPRTEAGASFGVYVEARVEARVATADDDDDQDALFDRAGVIDAAEVALRAAGFSLPLLTTSAVLAVKPLEQIADRLVALAEAKALHARLVTGAASDRIAVVLCVHEGADVRKLSSWMPGRDVAPGAWATGAAVGSQDLASGGVNDLYSLEIAQGPPRTADQESGQAGGK